MMLGFGEMEMSCHRLRGPRAGRRPRSAPAGGQPAGCCAVGSSNPGSGAVPVDSARVIIPHGGSRKARSRSQPGPPPRPHSRSFRWPMPTTRGRFAAKLGLNCGGSQCLGPVPGPRGPHSSASFVIWRPPQCHEPRSRLLPQMASPCPL